MQSLWSIVERRLSLRFLTSSLFLAIMVLLGIGLVQVYSSSYVLASEIHGDGLYFFKRQVLFALAAFLLMIFTIQIPLQWIDWRERGLVG